MAYFVTGGSGIIGRFLLAELLARRERTICCLCRASCLDKFDDLKGRLALAPEVVGKLDGRLEPLFHLAVIYEITADADSRTALEPLAVGGLMRVLTQVATAPQPSVNADAQAARTGARRDRGRRWRGVRPPRRPGRPQRHRADGHGGPVAVRSRTDERADEVDDRFRP